MAICHQYLSSFFYSNCAKKTQRRRQYSRFNFCYCCILCTSEFISIIIWIERLVSTGLLDVVVAHNFLCFFIVASFSCAVVLQVNCIFVCNGKCEFGIFLQPCTNVTSFHRFIPYKICIFVNQNWEWQRTESVILSTTSENIQKPHQHKIWVNKNRHT